ncbi:MAG: tyrosine-type recombinase/integrase [Patescibacteria group bacterium]|nr:tyrosine-type recombinase/integrase [Patescibacteria group bacterium]
MRRSRAAGRGGERSPKPGQIRKKRALPAYLTPREKDDFFSVITSARDRALFRLLYHHGLRVSEIGKLQLSDYRKGPSLDMDRLRITALKGSVSGEAAVVQECAKAMRQWLRIRGNAPGPLFPSRMKSPVNRRTIWKMMKTYSALAGLPAEKSHPHCWKHTCGTHLVSEQKESIIDVQKHLRHADIRSTMIYVQLADEAGGNRAKRLKDWK